MYGLELEATAAGLLSSLNGKFAGGFFRGPHTKNLSQKLTSLFMSNKITHYL
jgi:hypothetical protein